MRNLFADDMMDEDGDTEEPTEPGSALQAGASKAWRSIERYREMKELRRHLDDFIFDDIPGKRLKDLHL